MNGALIPHAPLLLEEVGPDDDSLRPLREGIARVTVPTDATVVLASPHGEGSFVHAQPSGTLDGFGIEDITVGPPPAPEATEILAAWGGTAADVPLDHGSIVPLHLLQVTQPVVAVSVGRDASGLARAISAIGSTHDIFVICSAHTSARLTERAPLPYSFDAVRLDARFVTEVEQDCAAALAAAPGLVTTGGSCSGSTLSLFGELFAGRAGIVEAYGAPFGVGYPVVTAQRDG